MLKELTGHTSSIWSVDISTNGKYLASVSKDHKIKIWNFNSCQETINIRGNHAHIVTITFSHDGHYIFSGCDNNTMKMLKILNGK